MAHDPSLSDEEAKKVTYLCIPMGKEMPIGVRATLFTYGYISRDGSSLCVPDNQTGSMGGRRWGFVKAGDVAYEFEWEYREGVFLQKANLIAVKQPKRAQTEVRIQRARNRRQRRKAAKHG